MRLLKGDRHRRWQQDLSAYIDGQLEPRQQRALEAHLAECSSCQQELESLWGVVALLHRVPQVRVPRTFTLAEAPARRTWLGTIPAAPLRYATAAAALLLLAVAVGDLVTGQSPAVAPAAPVTEREVGQAAVEPTEELTLMARAPAAAEATPVPEGVPTPQPMAAAAPEQAEGKTAETIPMEPEPEEPWAAPAYLRWVEVGLGGLLAALSTLVAVQWWLGRRRSSG